MAKARRDVLGFAVFPAVRQYKGEDLTVALGHGGRDRIRTCCRRVCCAPLIRMSFPSVGAAPLCYHRSRYEIDRGERNRTSLQADPAAHVIPQGRLSDAPAGKESEVKKSGPGPRYGMPRIMPRGSEAFTFSREQLRLQTIPTGHRKQSGYTS